MSWDFETDSEYQRLLDWASNFVTTEVEPLDLVLGDPFDKSDRRAMAMVKPLEGQVKEQGLWACHLGPELGGKGYGQVKLALLNEIIGRSRWAPSVFGCQAPDSGNAEILAHYGSSAQKARYLRPLLDGEISSCYSMTEPHGGADPTLFRTTATRAGNEWVINGEKWFSSNARYASFMIVMAVTNADVSAYKGMSMFIVPAETPGVQDRPKHQSHRRARRRGAPCVHPLQRRTGSCGPPIRGRGRGIRHRADAARRRTCTSCYAHDSRRSRPRST